MKALALALPLALSCQPAPAWTWPAPAAAPAHGPSSAPRTRPPPKRRWRPKRLSVTNGGVCAVHEGQLYCVRYDAYEDPPPIDDIFTPSHHIDLPAAVVDVAMSDKHTCAITRDEQLYCWGENDHGQLGTGHKTSQPAPVKVPGLGPALEVSVSAKHSCVRQRDGTVACWGSNLFGEVGHDTAYTGNAVQLVRPVVVKGLDDVRRVWVSRNRTCVQADEEVLCWGGIDGTKHPTEPRPVPLEASPLETVRARCTWQGWQMRCDKEAPIDVHRAVLGDDYLCTLKTNGGLICRYVQPTDRGYESNIVEREAMLDLAAAEDTPRVCALDAKRLYCWSDAEQLGLATDTADLPARR